jgi:hypothetical protein
MPMSFQQTLPSLFRMILPAKKGSRFYFFIVICFTASSLQLVLPRKALCDVPSSGTIVMPQTTQVCLPSFQTSSMKRFFDNVGQYFGIRYRFGGQTPAGFDCSGFVRFMYNKAFNMHLPRSSREMSAIGNKISKNELQPGDLVFFQTRGQQINHVGIYIGNDTFVHSSLSKGIAEDKLKFQYYEKRFAGAVRLLDLSNDQAPDHSVQEQTATDVTQPS